MSKIKLKYNYIDCKKIIKRVKKNFIYNVFFVFNCGDWNRIGSFGDSLDVGGVRGESISSGRGLVLVGW